MSWCGYAEGMRVGCTRRRVDLSIRVVSLMDGMARVTVSDFDPDTPTPARMYDYFLGGKDNFAADRAAAQKVIESLGEILTRDVVSENRLFLERVVRFLAGECGIEQFVDLGAGLPTVNNTHQIAHAINPDARVVYVDNDPQVLAHGRALLADNPNTTVITADMRDPQAIITHPDVVELIDWNRPVALLAIAVFHFLREEESPRGIVDAFGRVMAAGSYLAISHLTTDGPRADQRRDVEKAYEVATSPMVFRSPAAIVGLLDDFELVAPGLVRAWCWHADPTQNPPSPMTYLPQTNWLYAAVGHKT